MTITSQAAAGVRWTSLSSVLSTAANATGTLVLARLLSPVDFGLMAMVSVVIGFAQMYMDLGVSAAIIHRQDTADDVLSSLYWLNVFCGLFLFGLVLLFSPMVVWLFREPRLAALLRTVALIFLVMPLGSQFEILLRKELQFKKLAAQDVAGAAGSTVIAIACALAGFGVWSLVWGALTNAILRTVLLIKAGLGVHRPSFHFRRADLKGYVGFGMFQIGERSLNYMSQRFDQILIGPLLGARTLGFYNFAFNLTSQPLWSINPILTKVAFPMFSKVQHDTEKLKRGYVKLIAFLSAVNAPLLIGLAAVAPVAVPLIFGAKWTESVLIVQILCFLNLLRCTGNPIGSLQLAKGRADLGFWWTMLEFFVTIPAIFIGAKLGHATGTALALLVAQVTLMVPMYLYMVRPLIGRCAQEYGMAILKPIAIAVAMALLVLVSRNLLNSPSQTAELAIEITVGVVSYTVLLIMLNRQLFTELRSALLPS